MNTPTPNFYLNFIYHAQRLADRVKAVRHHPLKHPLLLFLLSSTSSHQSATSRPTNETTSSFFRFPFAALLLSFLLLELQGLALFNLRNNRHGSPAGGSTDFSAGCLKHVKDRLDTCGSCVCVEGALWPHPFNLRHIFFSQGLADELRGLHKDVLIMLYVCSHDQ